MPDWLVEEQFYFREHHHFFPWYNSAGLGAWGKNVVSCKKEDQWDTVGPREKEILE